MRISLFFCAKILIFLEVIKSQKVTFRVKYRQNECSSKCASFNIPNIKEIVYVDDNIAVFDIDRGQVVKSPYICCQCYETFKIAKFLREACKKYNLVQMTYKRSLDSETRLFKNDEKGYLGIFAERSFVIKEDLNSPLHISFLELNADGENGFKLPDKQIEYSRLPALKEYIKVFFSELNGEFRLYDIIENVQMSQRQGRTFFYFAIAMNVLFFSISITTAILSSLKGYKYYRVISKEDPKIKIHNSSLNANEDTILDPRIEEESQMVNMDENERIESFGSNRLEVKVDDKIFESDGEVRLGKMIEDIKYYLDEDMTLSFQDNSDSENQTN